MKKSIGILSFIVISLLNYTYAQNTFWALPNNNVGSGYINIEDMIPFPFPTTDPVTGGTYTDPFIGYVPSLNIHKGAANAQFNLDDELIFFIVGNDLFDKNGRTIYSGYYDDEVTSGYSEICVVPNPGNCNQYYIFTDRSNSGNNQFPFDAILQPYFSILDVSIIQNGDVENCDPGIQGKLIQDWSPLNSLTPLTISISEKSLDISYACTPLNANGERVLVVKYYVQGQNGFRTQIVAKFKIDGLGISYFGLNEVVNNLSITSDLGAIVGSIGRTELEIIISNNDNLRVAFASHQQLIVYDLDPITLNVIPGSIVIKNTSVSTTPSPFFIPAYTAGVEFSPNGRYVYISHSPGDVRTNVIDCYDKSTDTWVVLPWSTDLASAGEFRFSYIEMGVDGGMYLSNGSNLAQISNPDNPTVSTFNSTYQSINYLANFGNQITPNSWDKRYTLPDQIDGQDYDASMLLTCQCCADSRAYDYDYSSGDCADLLLGGPNQIWTGTNNPINNGMGNTVYIKGDLIIPPGLNVTIVDMEFKFHPDAKMVVERSDDPLTFNGAKVILDGTTLTVDDRCFVGGDFCKEMWQGVLVEGYTNMPQTPIDNSKQGYLKMVDFSKIEHALVGVQAYNPLDATDGGGIIRTVNSTFRNNRIDVRIWNYDFFDFFPILIGENQCNFNKTKFITDDYLNDASLTPFVHAFIYKANGVRFEGCEFNNTFYNFYNENQRGYGILNVSSKLTVIPACTSLSTPCSSYQPNKFENLFYGVVAITGSSLIPLLVDGNEFKNNLFGVYVGSVDFATIIRNDFEVARSNNPNPALNRTYGIYLRSCTGFAVEENNFKDFDNLLIASSFTRGIIVDNSLDGIPDPVTGIPHNEIYKNNFQDILIGGQSQGINSPDHFPGPSPNPVSGGLQWLCNDFDAQILVDLYVSSGRIDYQQGYDVGVLNPYAPFAGARNLFSHIDGGWDYFAAPTVQTFTYTHYLNSVTKPNLYTGAIITDLDEIPLTMDYNTSCPTNLSVDYSGFGSGDIGTVLTKMAALKSEIANESSKIDAGDTDGLLSSILNSSGGNLKNILINASPYLSDEVLIAYMNTNPSNGNLKLVLLANSPLSPTVLLEYQQLNLPNGIANQINNAQNGTSEMSYLLNRINYLGETREYWVNAAIRYYLNSTDIQSPMDSIIDILKLEDRSVRKEQLCDAYIIKGDLANATIIKNEIISEKGVNNFTRLADINIETRFSSDPLKEINDDPAKLDEIHNIATDATDQRICPRGESLLYEFVYANSVYYNVEPLLLPGGSPKGQVTIDNQKEGNTINIYPNPADDNLTIDLTDLKEKESLSLEIHNLMGQVVYFTPLPDGQFLISVDVSQVLSGFYFIRILQNGVEIAVNKILIE